MTAPAKRYRRSESSRWRFLASSKSRARAWHHRAKHLLSGTRRSPLPMLEMMKTRWSGRVFVEVSNHPLSVTGRCRWWEAYLDDLSRPCCSRRSYSRSSDRRHVVVCFVSHLWNIVRYFRNWSVSSLEGSRTSDWKNSLNSEISQKIFQFFSLLHSPRLQKEVLVADISCILADRDTVWSILLHLNVSTFELRSRIAFWLDSLEQQKHLRKIWNKQFEIVID
jgi:hypothetical protein